MTSKRLFSPDVLRRLAAAIVAAAAVGTLSTHPLAQKTIEFRELPAGWETL